LPAELREPDFIAVCMRIFDFRRRRFTLLQLRLQRKFDGARSDWSAEVQRREVDGFVGVVELPQRGGGAQGARNIHLNVHLAFAGRHVTFSKTAVCSDMNQLAENCVQRLLEFGQASPRLKFFKQLLALRDSRCNRVRALEPATVVSIQHPRTYTVTT